MGWVKKNLTRPVNPVLVDFQSNKSPRAQKNVGCLSCCHINIRRFFGAKFTRVIYVSEY
jgi:hypothetical protein